MLDRRVARDGKKWTRSERDWSRMLTILANTCTLVIMADHCGSLLYVNPAGRRMLGLASDDDISEITLIDCVAPGIRNRIAEVAIPTATSNGVWSGDSVLVGRGGRQIDVSLMIIANYGSDGRLEGLSFLGQDMTAWTRTEEALRKTQGELLRLSAQHLKIQENERRQIAADLHDGLGQSLSLVTVSMENVTTLLAAGEADKAAQRLERLKSKVKDMLDDVRRIAMNLRPATLDSLGILPTMSWHLREIEAVCPDLTLERNISVEEADVPIFLKTAIFRILQEASSNAIKHAGANRVKVSLGKKRGILELVVEDNGQGFDAAGVSGRDESTKGLGLQSMKERALLSCGIYEMKSVRGKGTQIRVTWPLALDEEELDRAATLAPEIQALDSLTSVGSGTPRSLPLPHEFVRLRGLHQQYQDRPVTRENMLRILIADDRALVRAGVRALLSQTPDFQVVGESDNGRDAVRAVGELKPHIVLMDLTMPGMNGMEAIMDIKRRYPDTRVLVLTLHKTEEFIRASLKAGADGYVLKEATPGELLAAVRCVSSGKTYLSQDVSWKVARGDSAAANSSAATGIWDTLTQREREVLKLVAEGKSNKEIAEFLFLSVKTVEKHRATLMAKLGIRNAAALTAYAIEKGLVVT